MPLYSYRCTGCGDFREWNILDRAGDRVACPDCGKPSARILSAPYLGMERGRRIAHERNEKSAHEPRVMSRGQLDKSGKRRGHAHARGHSHQQHHDGKTWQRSSRPWMIGH